MDDVSKKTKKEKRFKFYPYIKKPVQFVPDPLFTVCFLLAVLLLYCCCACVSIHHDFLERFEHMVESFISSEGSNVEDFIVDAKKLMDGVSLTIFEETGHEDFLNSVFSCLEYKHFHNIMINAGRRKKFGNGRRRKHKGKSKKEKRLAKAQAESDQLTAARSSKK